MGSAMPSGDSPGRADRGIGLADPDTLSTDWRWAKDGPVAVGSEDHKALFCATLLETHDRYRPAVIDWPALDEAALARLTCLPFWDIAVETEVRAAVRIEQMAERESDPLIAKALSLMAFEEHRHKHVIEAMIRNYDIPLAEQAPYQAPRRAEWFFLRTGYGECFDSFFAFGLFDLAKRSGFFPPELVDVFEPVIQEEARHILFFVNWAAYVQANRPLLARPGFFARRMGALLVSAWARATLAKKGDDRNFSVDARGVMDIKVTAGGLMDLCLEENARRLGRLDPRLLQPRLVPRLVRLTRPLMGT